MSIKVKVEKKGQGMEREYPYLGIAENGLIVLFTELTTGYVLNVGNSTNTLFKFSSNWAEFDFDVFHGSITLTQE